jgi:hypothetical protein
MASPPKYAAYALCLILLATPFALAESPKSALLDSFKSETTVPRERLTVKWEHAGVTVMQTWEIERPNGYHFMQMGASGRQEFFLLGNSLYTKNAAGWSRLDVPSVPKPPIADMLQTAIIDSIDRVLLEGSETLRGQETNHYRAQIRVRDIRRNMSGVMDVWVAKVTGLPLQINFVGQLGNESYQVEKSLEYDSNIRVVAPD